MTTKEAPVAVLDRAFAILAAFHAEDRHLSLRELAARTGIPRSTVHRIALRLVAWRALERVGTDFRLGLRLFELGEHVPIYRELRESAIPFMLDVYEATHATVSIGMLDGTNVVYLAIISGHDSHVSLSRSVSGLPSHRSAIGKVLLAFGGPALVGAVIRTGLAPRTGYSISSPQLLVAELKRVERTAMRSTARKARSAWCASRHRSAVKRRWSRPCRSRGARRGSAATADPGRRARG